MERIFSRFKQAMQEEKEIAEIGFDIAYGYAYFNPDIDRDLQSTFNRADSKMYACKKKMKDAINK
jgi:GGDEF domain-containing protein